MAVKEYRIQSTSPGMSTRIFQNMGVPGSTNRGITHTYAQRNGLAFLTLTFASTAGGHSPVYWAAPESKIRSSLGLQDRGASGEVGADPGTGPGGTGVSGGAADAIETQNPQIKLGGKSFELGPGHDNVVGFSRETVFRGLETAIPDTDISDTLSPHSVNFDGRVPGSLCIRKGMLKYDESLLTSAQSSNSNNPVDPTWDGLDILWIQPNDNSGGFKRSGIALLLYADGIDVGAAGLANMQIVNLGPHHAPPKTLKGRPGPVLTAAANGLSVDLSVAAYTNHPTDRNDVVQISIRLSTIGFPESIEGEDDKESVPYTEASVEFDRRHWDGAAIATAPHDIEYDPLTTVYITSWAISREGVTEPSFTQVDI